MANDIGNGNNWMSAYLNVQYLKGSEDLLRRAATDTTPAPDFKGTALQSLFGKQGDLSGVVGTPNTSEVNPLDFSDPIGNAAVQLTTVMDQVTSLAFSLPAVPSESDSSHPDGLSVDKNGVITTPGGFKIEAISQYEWKITGPDGKDTRIWGDPHVYEKDGGKWDFKRDSTFVLADGTRINCSTTKWSNDMTVTKGLEIIAGNQRVEVKDIDKGKGKVGEITNDGYAHVNSFGNKDVFVMGKESDDWSFNGKEIIGSEQNGEKFKLGGNLEPGVIKPACDHAKANGGKEYFAKVLDQIAKMFKALEEARVTGKMPDLGNLELPEISPESGGCWQKDLKPADGLAKLSKSFHSLAVMFDALEQLLNLTSSIPSRRTYQNA